MQLRLSCLYVYSRLTSKYSFVVGQAFLVPEMKLLLEYELLLVVKKIRNVFTNKIYVA
jgi:hypothetical protein